MYVDFKEMTDGDLSIVDALDKLKRALDVEPVTKKFYAEFREKHLEFIEHIHGIDDERERQWYASVLLNRLMFVYFLQRKGFLDGGDYHYLQHHIESSR